MCVSSRKSSTRLRVLSMALLTEPDIALQVLDNVIMTRWKVLPREQCQGKNYDGPLSSVSLIMLGLNDLHPRLKLRLVFLRYP